MSERFNGLARHLRGVLRQDQPSDADLLARFAGARDGEAFADLVRRHGPMVLGVCRRVLRDHHAAEDAFQATFLVLARRAATIRGVSVLSRWLYTVAYRTAAEARRAAAVRWAKEQRAAEMRDAAVAPDDLPDLRDVLDRELAALPDIYRTAIVLCDLQGLARREAAKRLGWSEGTLSGRLSRGRALLARRLAKYGLAVSGGALAAMSQGSVAAVPGGLAAETARVGILVAAGQAVGAVAPASVAALTEGVMRAMLLTKLKGATAGLMVACAVLTTGAAGWVTAEAQDRPAAADRSPTADQPGKRGPETDKERIARLEREREVLLKLVADLRARVQALEAGQKTALNREAQEQFDAWSRGARNKAPDGYLNQLGGPGSPEPKAAPQFPQRQPAGAPGGLDVNEVWGHLGASNRMSVKVYAVDGLAGDDKQAESLVRVLKAAVDPASWQGGAGVEYYPTGQALVVRQTAEGHQQVREVLDLLRGAVKPHNQSPLGGGGFPGAAR
jgi:RNA polymerase sigma factor (sigma-70 family)